MAKSSATKLLACPILLGAAILAGGCSSSNSSGATSDTPVSGVVLGPLDSHCTAPDGGLMIQTVGVCPVIDPTVVPTDTSICLPVTFGPDDVDAGTGTVVDAGADAAAPAEYGATMYGAAGNDDDCKYYVSWVSTPIQENADTYFTVTALRLEDMKPVRCAGIRAD